MRPDCDSSSKCTRNCCISFYAAPIFFITFVLFAQFVLVNIVIAVLMKHLRVTKLCKSNLHARKESLKMLPIKEDAGRNAFTKWQKVAGKQKSLGEDGRSSCLQTKRNADGAEEIELEKCRENETKVNLTFIDDTSEKKSELLVGDKNGTEVFGELDKSRKYLWQRNASFKTKIESNSDSIDEVNNCNKDHLKEKSSRGISEISPIISINQSPNGNNEKHIFDEVSENHSHDCSIEIPEDCNCDINDDGNVDQVMHNEIELRREDFVDDTPRKEDEADDMTKYGYDDIEMKSHLNNPICTNEERISFSGSPVLNIPDDFFTEDEKLPLKSSKCLDVTEDDEKQESKKRKRNRSQNTPRTESIETCGSFEILPECCDLCKENNAGSDESFAMVSSDPLKISKV